MAVFAAANLAVDRFSGYFQEQHKYHDAVAALASHPRVTVLFAGDSHIAHALNERLNANAGGLAYSVAYQGDSLRECYAKLRYALAHSRKIDTIVISAELHMFGRGRLSSSNRAFADRYFLMAGDSSGLDRSVASALLNQVPLLNDDYVQYLRKLAMARFKAKEDRGAENGAKPLAWQQLSEAERGARARAVGKGDHQEIGMHPEPFQWYGRILQLARQHDVRVVGIRLPVHREYAVFSPPAQTAAIDRFLRDHGIAEIVDLRGLLTDAACFDDPDHVNQRGLEPLLRELQKHVRGPLEES